MALLAQADEDTRKSVFSVAQVWQMGIQRPLSACQRCVLKTQDSMCGEEIIVPSLPEGQHMQDRACVESPRGGYLFCPLLFGPPPSYMHPRTACNFRAHLCPQLECEVHAAAMRLGLLEDAAAQQLLQAATWSELRVAIVAFKRAEACGAMLVFCEFTPLLCSNAPFVFEDKQA